MLEINVDKVLELRDHIKLLMRDADFMFDDGICKYDMPEVLATMYEYINILVLGEPYNYMFHWANKCGSWVDTNWFDRILEDRIKEDQADGGNE